MTEPYTLIGSEMSPYSVKVRAYCRYKELPFDWEERSFLNRKKFAEHAKVPLVPLLIRPDGSAIQDSTLIIEQELEPKYPQPDVRPPEPAAQFLSSLLEEFADEWGNKLMFYQRWRDPKDQQSAAARLAKLMFGVTWWGKLAQPVAARMIQKRMVPRVSFVGASEANVALLQRSWQQLVADLEAHIASRQYLFGGRPTLADFSLYGQLVQAYSDPTAGDYLRANASQLLGWLERMASPRVKGDFEPLDALYPTLAPVLENTVAKHFLPWADANARAFKAGEKTVSLQLDGYSYSQQVFKYHAVSLAALRDKFQAVSEDEQTVATLRKLDCLQFFN